MDQKQYRINIVIIILLFFLFLSSIFLIVGTKYNLWMKWFAEEEQSYTLSLVTQETKWKYMDIGEEPGVGNVWTTEKYDANTWKERQGIFEKQLSKDNLSSTAFFRYEFNIEDISKYKHIEGNIKYKDAVIVYLNGSIIYTGNIPSGGYYSNQDMGASNTLDTIAEGTFYVSDLNHLKEGKNILAVEVHRKDKDSTNIYFDFPYLIISEIDKEEVIPDTKGMILAQGRKSDELEINWMTDSNKPYKVEFMEGTKDQFREAFFSKYSTSVIMGSKWSEYNKTYINTGTLTRLKENTNYIYRIIQIGGKEGSYIYEFHTAEKQDIRFGFTGVVQSDYMNNNERISIFQDKIKKGIELIKDIDFLILGKEKLPYDNDVIKRNEIGLRSPKELKEIPMIVTEYGKAKEEDTTNYYWTYSDMLIISLDGINKDYKENHKFMEQVISSKNRKWIIVLMNTSIFQEDGEINNKYKEMFEEFDVDIVLDKGTSYSRYYDGKQIFTSDNILKKNKGETFYITGGVFFGLEEKESSIIKIKSTRMNIEIETYRIEDGNKLDFIQLVK